MDFASGKTTHVIAIHAYQNYLLRLASLTLSYLDASSMRDPPRPPPLLDLTYVTRSTLSTFSKCKGKKKKTPLFGIQLSGVDWLRGAGLPSLLSRPSVPAHTLTRVSLYACSECRTFERRRRERGRATGRNEEKEEEEREKNPASVVSSLLSPLWKGLL